MVDVKDYAKVASIENGASKSGYAVVLRQQPVWMSDEKIFMVTLLVNRDAVQKFAKIEETVPEGYFAANVDSRDGIFTFKDQVAKFIWLDLPSDPYFTVSYKLIPEFSATSAPESLRLAGVFSYMLNERSFSSNIIQRNETLAGLNSMQVNALLHDINVRATEQPVRIADAQTSPSKTTPTNLPQTPPTSTPKTQPPSIIKPSEKTLAATVDMDEMLAPESGIYYRVQIAAGHKPVNAQKYFRKHKLTYSVYREEHDGWYKYSVGSFAEYKLARDYRVHLSNQTTLNDAFIAAYNNGKRITVQDALMALNDKWYR